jgi:hypothetical protein
VAKSLTRFSPRRDLGPLYRKHFDDRAKERRLLSTAGFLAAFAAARAVTHAIRDGVGPFGNISAGGRHIHHMTFGIVGLLGTGYAWLNEFGTGAGSGRRASRVTAVLYGVGSALTLDEFALWLNLEDDYWTKEGRESIDAVVIFGSLLALGATSRKLLAELAATAFSRKPERAPRRGSRLARRHTRRALALLADRARGYS